MENLEANLDFYINHFRRMNNIERFSTTPKVGRHQSVSEHTLNVIYISYLIVDTIIGHDVIDYKKLYYEAINHDLIEVFTGDIIKPFKIFSDEEFNDSLKKSENKLLEKLENKFNIKHLKPFEGSLEGFIVRVSDVYEAFCFSCEQVKMGNANFLSHKIKIKESYINFIKESNPPERFIHTLIEFISISERVFNKISDSSNIVLELKNEK